MPHGSRPSRRCWRWRSRSRCVDLVVATHLGMGSLTDHAPRVLLVAATLVGVWLLLVVVR
ncbi:hypothetical protein AB4Z54_11555 [Streptomyces sp. MCAF7]